MTNSSSNDKIKTDICTSSLTQKGNSIIDEITKGQDSCADDKPMENMVNDILGESSKEDEDSIDSYNDEESEEIENENNSILPKLSMQYTIF